jgi:hypothetical protein
VFKRGGVGTLEEGMSDAVGARGFHRDHAFGQLPRPARFR